VRVRVRMCVNVNTATGGRSLAVSCWP